MIKAWLKKRRALRLIALTTELEALRRVGLRNSYYIDREIRLMVSIAALQATTGETK